MAERTSDTPGPVQVRIALVVPEYPPDTIGGGGVVYAALAKRFGDHHEIAVFSAWDARRSWAESPTAGQVDGVNIRRYQLLPVLRTMPNLRSVLPPNPRGIASLRNDLRRWAPDVGHLHGYGHAFVDVGAAILRRSGTPYVFTFHGVPTTQAGSPAPVRAAYWAYQATVLRRTVKGAAVTTAVSSDAAGDWQVDQVIPNGIAAPASAPSPADPSALRRRFDLPEAPLVLGIGRLARSKGFDLLIEATSLLASSGAAVILAGADGGAEASLRALAERTPARIIFTGNLDRDDVASLLHAAAVVVVPSRDEPFGLVPLEALQAGTRVVATSVGGLRLTVRPPFGELVPPNDVAALAAAIDRALSADAFTAPELEAVAAVLEQFSWPRLVIKYERLLAHVAGPRWN